MTLPSWRPLPTALTALVLLLGCAEKERPELFGSKSGKATSTAPDGNLAWPLEGQIGRDWIVVNYVDRDPSGVVRDYRDGAKSYDGHHGVDIAIGGFRFMDRGVDVHAAASGVVEFVQGGLGDRSKAFEVGCQLPANRVFVRHRDGTTGQYFHLKRGSVVVTVGDKVAAGDVIGKVGSSGCSQSPHVHFELRSATNEVIDPFEKGLWAKPPPYEVPLALMDVVVAARELAAKELWDPPQNAQQVALGSPFGFAVITGGARPGDAIEVTLGPQGGATALTLNHVYDGTEGLQSWFWNETLTGPPGLWTAKVRINAASVRDLEFRAE